MKNPCVFFPDFLGDAKVAPSEGAPQGRPRLFQLHDPLFRLETEQICCFYGDFMVFFLVGSF